jgi:hypothetical protein
MTFGDFAPHPASNACGAVRFEAKSEPKFVANCHCRDCRRATGAAFTTWVGYDTPDVTWHGERSLHNSSPTVMRGFCAICGTPLSYSGKQWAAETHLLIGTFDDADSLAPDCDAFAAEKLPWVCLLAQRD